MLTGFATMDTVEKAIVGFAGVREHDKITDSTLSRTIMNQHQALGLVNASLIGFTLTDLGKKVKRIKGINAGTDVSPDVMFITEDGKVYVFGCALSLLQ